MDLLKKLYQFQQNGYLCDVTVMSCDGEEVVAHAGVLAAALSEFREKMEECDPGHYTLVTSMTKNEIIDLIHYAYTGDNSSSIMNNLSAMYSSSETSTDKAHEDNIRRSLNEFSNQGLFCNMTWQSKQSKMQPALNYVMAAKYNVLEDSIVDQSEVNVRFSNNVLQHIQYNDNLMANTHLHPVDVTCEAWQRDGVTPLMDLALELQQPNDGNVLVRGAYQPQKHVVVNPLMDVAWQPQQHEHVNHVEGDECESYAEGVTCLSHNDVKPLDPVSDQHHLHDNVKSPIGFNDQHHNNVHSLAGVTCQHQQHDVEDNVDSVTCQTRQHSYIKPLMDFTTQSEQHDLNPLTAVTDEYQPHDVPNPAKGTMFKSQQYDVNPLTSVAGQSQQHRNVNTLLLCGNDEGVINDEQDNVKPAVDFTCRSLQQDNLNLVETATCQTRKYEKSNSMEDVPSQPRQPGNVNPQVAVTDQPEEYNDENHIKSVIDYPKHGVVNSVDGGMSGTRKHNIVKPLMAFTCQSQQNDHLNPVEGASGNYPIGVADQLQQISEEYQEHDVDSGEDVRMKYEQHENVKPLLDFTCLSPQHDNLNSAEIATCQTHELEYPVEDFPSQPWQSDNVTLLGSFTDQPQHNNDENPVESVIDDYPVHDVNTIKEGATSQTQKHNNVKPLMGFFCQPQQNEHVNPVESIYVNSLIGVTDQPQQIDEDYQQDVVNTAGVVTCLTDHHNDVKPLMSFTCHQQQHGVNSLICCQPQQYDAVNHPEHTGVTPLMGVAYQQPQ